MCVCVCVCVCVCGRACVNKQRHILDIDTPTRAIMVNNVSVMIDGQLQGWDWLVHVCVCVCVHVICVRMYHMSMFILTFPVLP